MKPFDLFLSVNSLNSAKTIQIKLKWPHVLGFEVEYFFSIENIVHMMTSKEVVISSNCNIFAEHLQHW